MKLISVPRRYTVIKERNSVFIQFGFGTEENVEEVLDPSNVLINTHGKTYITDDSFDPASLIKTDSLGVSPSNTVLTIIYRVNSSMIQIHLRIPLMLYMILFSLFKVKLCLILILSALQEIA